MEGGSHAPPAAVLDQVRRIEIRTRRLVDGVLAGEYRSVFRGAGLEFEEVREYVEGDDPRAVDWNVTARTGRPFVKHFVDERHLTAAFVVDVSASMDAGGGPWTAREAAAQLCACLGLSAARHHDRVALIACSDRVESVVPPRGGRAHALRIVRDCLAVRAPGRGSDLAPGLRRAARALRGPAVVFVLSDFLAGDWERAMRLCARRHDVVAVRLGHPDVDDPGGGRGMARVEDAEDGRRRVVDWGAPRVRAAWSQQRAAWRRDTEAALRRARADLLDVPLPAGRDPGALIRPLLSFFRARELRRARR